MSASIFFVLNQKVTGVSILLSVRCYLQILDVNLKDALVIMFFVSWLGVAMWGSCGLPVALEDTFTLKISGNQICMLTWRPIVEQLCSQVEHLPSWKTKYKISAIDSVDSQKQTQIQICTWNTNTITGTCRVSPGIQCPLPVAHLHLNTCTDHLREL